MTYMFNIPGFVHSTSSWMSYQDILGFVTLILHTNHRACNHVGSRQNTVFLTLINIIARLFYCNVYSLEVVSR